MSFLIWSEEFSVRIPSIDNQHKKLVDLMEQLTNAISAGKGNEVVSGILDELIDYTSVHFKYEEDIFEKYDYPQNLEHKKAHSQLIESIKKHKKALEDGEKHLPLNVMAFLYEWLTNHILKDDMEYSDFLVSKGVK